MKCPFIPGSCIGRECPGWSLGKCFLEIFLQKMDNISLKLDTLCNLTSIAVTAQVPRKKFDPAASPKDTKAGIEPTEDPQRGHKQKESVPLEENVLSDFPMRVSDFSFLNDLADELPGRKSTSPVRIEVTELPLESPPAEELPLGASDEVAMNERLLLMGQPINGSGTQAAPHDNISPAFYEELAPDNEPSFDAVPGQEQTQQSAGAEEPIEAIGVTDRADVGDSTRSDHAVGSDSHPIPEMGDASFVPETIRETLSVEQVIKDITQDTRSDLANDVTDSMATAPASEQTVKPLESAARAVQAATQEFFAQTADLATNLVEETTPIPQEKPTPPQPAGEPITAMQPMTESKASDGGAPDTAQAPGQPVEETGAQPKPVEEPSTVVELKTPVVEEPTSAPVEEASAPAMTAKEPTTSGIDSGTDEVPQIPAAPIVSEPAEEAQAPFTSDIEVLVEEMPGASPEPSGCSDPASWTPIDVVEARGGAVLGIDFGSALSKVALKPDAGSPATAIPLALSAYDILHKAGLMSRFESKNEYVEDSLIYFDHNEFVFCGALAKKLSMEAAESGEGRPAIQNLKTFLVRGGANLQIHSDFFPASESMDSQSVLAVYLAYLMRLTRHYLTKRAAKIPTDLDTTLRAFAIPTWIEDRYREDVKRLFRGAAAYAFCLERWLKDDLVKGVRLADLKAAFEEARQHKLRLEDNLVGSIMTESVAVGNSRLIGIEHEKARPLTLLIVNVGAAFTDFALFSISNPENRGAQPMAQVAYKGGVGTGLGIWDNALKTLLFNKVKEVPAARRKTNEFRLLKARLELSVRDIKEELLATGQPLPMDVSPVLPEPLSIERAELESALPVKAALFGIRDGLRTYIKEAIKAVGMHRFDPVHTEILITGGGAYVPAVVDCVREAVATLGPAYPARVRSEYVSALYASIPNIATIYPLLAVSLGVTEDEVPDEQITVVAPPVSPGANARAPQQPKAAVNATITAKPITKLKLA